MNPKDTELRNGERQPAIAAERRKGDEWTGMKRTFQHEALGRALDAMGLRPRTAKT